MCLGSYLLLGWLSSGAGLTLTFFDGVGADRRARVEQVSPSIDLTILDANDRLPRRFFSIRWRGVWRVAEDGLYDLSITGDGRVSVSVDGQIATTHPRFDPVDSPRTVWLRRGYHPLDVDYEQEGDGSALTFSWAPAGGTLRPLDSRDLFLSEPENPARLEFLRLLGRALGFLGLVAVVLAGQRGCSKLVEAAQRRIDSRTLGRVGRTLSAWLLGLIVLYAAALRFDAMAQRFPVDRPPWLHTLQERLRAPLESIRPAFFDRAQEPNYLHSDGPPTPYISDPYTYLGFARAMPHFYAAHYREPFFPFVIRAFLEFLDDQDIAVSFASASFSVLLVWATYLLGSYVCSRWVGLGAALAMAIEYDVVSLSVDGWRDEAFACSVILFAYALLRFQHNSSRGAVILAGLVAGWACLIRITALSFVVPGLLYVLFFSRHPWRTRLRRIALAIALATTIVSPYLISCWIAFGDPLYPINYAAEAYQQRDDQVVEADGTIDGYLFNKIRSRPYETLDTVVRGLTTYPFLNKWRACPIRC